MRGKTAREREEKELNSILKKKRGYLKFIYPYMAERKKKSHTPVTPDTPDECRPAHLS